MNKTERKEMILQALQRKYQGDFEYHRANIDIYLSNPAGVGEHSDVLDAINTEIERMVAAEEKIHLLIQHWEF